MQIEPSRARSIADAIDAYDDEIAKLQEGKRDTFADLRAELESNGLDRATVRAEIASLKAAIAIRAKRRKDDAAEEREALTDDYLSALTCAPRATCAHEATSFPAPSPQPGRDPQSGHHGSDPGGRQVGESPVIKAGSEQESVVDQQARNEPGSGEAASGGERVTPLPETRPAVTRNSAAPIDLTNPALEGIQQEITRLEHEQRLLATMGFGPSHDDYREAETALETARACLARMRGQA